VPGKSITLAVVLLGKLVLPTFWSTVTPGKLPTFWFKPVRVLNKDVFPQLGLPTSAILSLVLLKSDNKCANKRRIEH
jgi:hypothetical protein